MERWRTQLGDRTEEFLQMAAGAERETGLQLGGRAYVRPKQTPDERLAPYYSLRNVSMMRECPLGDELYTPRLAETVRRHAARPPAPAARVSACPPWDDRQRPPRCPLCCRGGLPGPATHLQFVQAAVKMANAPDLSLRGGQRPTWRPERAARGSALGVQSREGSYVFAGGFPVIRPGPARFPRRFAPRNDNQGSIFGRRWCILDWCSCQRRSLSAATDAIGFYVFIGNRHES